MSKNEFTVKVKDKDVRLKTIKITPEIRLESQKHYAKALNEALNNDYFIKIEVDRILQSKGAVDLEAEEKQAAEARKKIKEMEVALRSAVQAGKRLTKSQGRQLALDIRAERLKLNTIGQNIVAFYDQTAENYANNAQTQFFIFACTVDAETGLRFWRSYEEFLTDTQAQPEAGSQTTTYLEAVKEFMALATGMDKDYERNRYENQWLIRMGFMNDKLQLIDDKGRTVDEEGRLINTEGRYINEAGEFLDVYGNAVDKDGNLLITDGWGDAPPAPAEKAVEVLPTPTLSSTSKVPA